MSNLVFYAQSTTAVISGRSGEEDITDIAVSYDGTWPARGHGT